MGGLTFLAPASCAQTPRYVLLHPHQTCCRQGALVCAACALSGAQGSLAAACTKVAGIGQILHMCTKKNRYFGTAITYSATVVFCPMKSTESTTNIIPRASSMYAPNLLRTFGWPGTSTSWTGLTICACSSTCKSSQAVMMLACS